MRINEHIRVPEVRVISFDGQQLGIMLTTKALEIAKNEGLDLIEVSPNATPPVVKVLDWGKFRYEQQKQKTKQKTVEVKGIRLGVKIGEHDLVTKLKLAEKFLGKKDKVKFQLRFKGREIVHKELGIDLLNKIIERMSEIAEVEQPPESAGRDMIMVLAPISNKKKSDNNKVTKEENNAENQNS
ncbi:MAG: translation initiation factor IF-3 [Patescibacteria group bacterium]